MVKPLRTYALFFKVFHICQLAQAQVINGLAPKENFDRAEATKTARVDIQGILYYSCKQQTFTGHQSVG